MDFITKELGRYRDVLTKQEIKTIRGQALAGNVEGARKGLKKILRRLGLDG